MAKPFDTTLKHLIEAYPRDWLRLVGISSSAEVEIVDADLATVTAEADKLFLIKGDVTWLLNLELQASYRTDLPDRLHFGGTLAGRRHGLSVQSIAILLRPEADGPAMNGRLIRQHPPDREYLEFRYDILRLWQLPVESILSGGLGVLPLAPLAGGAELQLDAIVAKMEKQFSTVPNTAEQGSLWAAAFVLMGLRYSRDVAEALFRRIHTMEESATYQAIVEKGISKGFSLGIVEGRVEGRVETAREFLLDLGTRRFGDPPAAILTVINSISDFPRLKRLTEQVLVVQGWNELLTTE